MPEQRLSLDGAWEFLAVADEHMPGPTEVRSIQVPGPWQAQFDDLRMRAGTAVYRRHFELPKSWDGKPAQLRFGAVFHAARVWMNGTFVGEAQGGFLPFSFDVTPYLASGTNELKVRVDSPTDNPLEYPDTPFAEIPFGKQSWYGPLSGIWQSVELCRRIPDHIAMLRLVPVRRTGDVTAFVRFAEPLAVDGTLNWSVVGPDGDTVRQGRVDVAAGAASRAFAFTVPAARDWSPDAPNLYRMEANLARRGETVDHFATRFGFRDIETRDGRFHLNGEPFYLLGALDQDYYPDMISTAPSMEFIRDQFRKAKQLGLNTLRCHIKAPDPRYYDAADEIGLLIWTELPNGGLSTERSRARKEQLLKGIVDRDGNHPSIVIWTIINENWGVDLVHDSDHRAWLRQTFAWLKSYDPTRLVVDNSPLHPSFHVETDIADYHYYAAYPDHRRQWDGFVDALAERPGWLFSPEGDAVIRGDEPVICSEFGNWGLPYPSDLRGPDGREPWWFETGHDWGEGVMYAHGVENRFTDWSLDRVFGTLRRFVEAAQWQQFRALKYEIEAMRRKPTLAGYVITEFTDCHWESNGLLDMRRNVRVFHDRFGEFNADRVLAPRWDRLSYWAGEPAAFDLVFADGTLAGLAGATLEIASDGPPLRRAVDLPPGPVSDLGRFEVPLPAGPSPHLATIRFRLTGPDGGVVAANTLDVAVYPPREEALLPRAAVWSPDGDLVERFAALGYGTAAGVDEAGLVVARGHDPALADRVRAGARLLLFPDRAMSLNPFFPHWQNVQVVTRDGTPWSGDWASSFGWLRRHYPFAHLPGGPLLEETLDRVLPLHVINGCNRLDFQARVHAGMVVGWIHKAVALVVEKPYGRGRVVVSTLRCFEDAPLADPAATAVLDALVMLALNPLPVFDGG